jgi:hypothetical protein
MAVCVGRGLEKLVKEDKMGWDEMVGWMMVHNREGIISYMLVVVFTIVALRAPICHPCCRFHTVAKHPGLHTTCGEHHTDFVNTARTTEGSHFESLKSPSNGQEERFSDTFSHTVDLVLGLEPRSR